jgi:ABC-type nitrate/sulfonate/bicarbonate transport system ATPase subunit
VLSLVRASDATVVFVTHDLEEAIYLGDRVIGLCRIPAVSASNSRSTCRGPAIS